MKKKNLKDLLPLVVFLFTGGLFAVSLYFIKPEGKYYANMVGTKINLTNLFSIVDNKKINITEPFILHVFASWCDACESDIALLKRLKGVTKIYGLVWHNDLVEARKLHLKTKIYEDVISEPSNQIIFNLGIRSIPETFIIEKDGIIVYSFKGPLTAKVIKDGFFQKLNEHRKVKPEWHS